MAFALINLSTNFRPMKLDQFIKKLQKLSQAVQDPRETEVLMADCIPVVSPILKDEKIFITDQVSTR